MLPGRRSRGADRRARAPASSRARSTCSRRGGAWCAGASRTRATSSSSIARTSGARAARLRAERDPHARLHPAAGGARRARAAGHGPRRLAALGEHAALEEFLTRNGQPFIYQDVETDPERAGAARPLPGRRRRRAGDRLRAAATCSRTRRSRSWRTSSGWPATLDRTTVRDVVIVGAGPGGPGGRRLRRLRGARRAGARGHGARRAGRARARASRTTSAFPRASPARRWRDARCTQAEKFGAEVAIGRRAVAPRLRQPPYRVILDDGEVVRTRAIVIATRRAVPQARPAELARFEGVGVFYSATHLEAQLCGAKRSSSSAAATRRARPPCSSRSSRRTCTCWCAAPASPRACRATSSSASKRAPTSRCGRAARSTRSRATTAWSACAGATSTRGEHETRPIRHVFLMTGADPNTEWLEGCVRLDDKRFVKTGADLRARGAQGAAGGSPRRPTCWRRASRACSRRRRAREQRQARRVGRRRGLDLRAARPPRAARALKGTPEPRPSRAPPSPQFLFVSFPHSIPPPSPFPFLLLLLFPLSPTGAIITIILDGRAR